MSANESIGSSLEKRRVEFLEPGVSLVKHAPKEDGACAIIVQIMLAFMFMTVGVLTILYSMSNASNGHGNNSHDEHSRFNPFVTQTCTNGILTVEQRKPDGSKQTTKYDLQWMQDDERQRLLLNKTTKANPDDFELFYVFKDTVIRLTKDNCVASNNTGYSQFMKTLGFDGLSRAGTEKINMDGRVSNINVYEGIPQASGPSHLSDQSIIYGFGFADFKTFLIRGWQVYFALPQNGQLATEWAEYWMPTVNPEAPNADLFVNLPSHCFKESE